MCILWKKKFINRQQRTSSLDLFGDLDYDLDYVSFICILNFTGLSRKTSCDLHFFGPAIEYTWWRGSLRRGHQPGPSLCSIRVLLCSGTIVCAPHPSSSYTRIPWMLSWWGRPQPWLQSSWSEVVESLEILGKSLNSINMSFMLRATKLRLKSGRWLLTSGSESEFCCYL